VDAHNNRESEAEAQLGLTILRRQFRRYEHVVKRTEALDVTAGSSLAGDRDAATYNPVPDLVHNAVGVALDHLHALLVSVEESGGMILAMSSFTLIRTAFEAAGTGLWLLHPPSRDERLLRSMRLTYDNRRQVRAVQVGIGKTDPGFERMHTRLREQMDARPGLTGMPLAKSLTPVTDRLKSVAVLVPNLTLPPLTLWQMASGVAHGNSSLMIGVLERQQVGASANGSAGYNVTSSVTSIALFYAAALDMVEALLDLYDSRNVAPGSR
jgi:hypothetical protein